MQGNRIAHAAALVAAIAPAAAAAAEFDATRLGLGWALPFVGILLSIASRASWAPRVLRCCSCGR